MLFITDVNMITAWKYLTISELKSAQTTS